MTNKEYQYYLKDLDKIKKNWHSVFSCFAGGGGSSLGYKLAGFDVLGWVEIDSKMAENYVKNLSPKYFYNEDIRDFLKREDLPKELYELDILDGSPPCTLFSVANHTREENKWVEKEFKEGVKKQTLDDLFSVFIKVANKLKPKVVVAENVLWLLHDNNKEYLKWIYKDLEPNYNVFHITLDSKNMGVPQSRKRVFFIWIRKDLNYPKKDIFWYIPDIDFDFKEKEITIWEIDHDNKWNWLWEEEAMLMKHYDPKKHTQMSHLKQEILWKNTCFNQKLLTKDIVCPTLRAWANDFIKTWNNKKLSEYEFKQIGTFPLDYKFHKYWFAYVIGMSVPPIMIKKIALKIKEGILDINK